MLGTWLETPPVRVRDPEAGVEYDVLTGGVGNNTHVYFNRASFTGDCRQLIFRSDRTGSWQIDAYDIAGQRLRRLTEASVDPGRPSIDQHRSLLYYTQGDEVHRMNIDMLEETVVYRHPTPAGDWLLRIESRNPCGKCGNGELAAT